MRRYRARHEVVLLAGALVVPALIQLAVGARLVPLLTPQTLSWMVVPMAVLLAAACASLPNPGLRAATLVGVVASAHGTTPRDGVRRPGHALDGSDAADCPLAAWERDVWIVTAGRRKRGKIGTDIEAAVSEGRTRDLHESWGRTSRYSAR